MNIRSLNSSLVAVLATAGFAFGQAFSIAPSTEGSQGTQSQAAVPEPLGVSTQSGGKSPYWPIQQVSATAPASPSPAAAGTESADNGTNGDTLSSADSGPSGRGYRIWGSADALLWWIRDGRLPAVVGTAPVGFAGVGQLPPGAINPTFGGIGPRLDYDEHFGGRLTGGFWLDPEQSCGVDVSYFHLEHKSIGFTATSSGDPLLGPVFDDPVQSRQIIVVAASPGFANGRFDLHTRERLWGGEANVRTTCCTVFSDRFEVFAGFRHIQFDEGLTSNTTATLLPALGGTNFNFFDSFGTHSRFYGPQVGMATEYRWNNWVLDFVGKIALGNIQQIVNITGFSTLTQPGAAPVTSLGGILALPTNIGHHTRDRFSAVPEVTVNLSYQMRSWARAFVGYNFLMVTNVVRPGDQIDGVDARQVPLLSGFDPTIRATRPVAHFNEMDFWAQGLNLGVEFRY